jgi:hypothetical protein
MNGNSSSSSVLEPHHSKMLELLQVSTADPLKQADPASITTDGFLSAANAGWYHVLETVLLVTEVCVTAREGAAHRFAGLLGSPTGSSSSSSSWQQLAPVLARMLVGAVQMVPDLRVRHAALKLFQAVAVRDSSVWSRSAAAGAAGDTVLQLGPAVLHAVMQQQQRQQQQQQQQEEEAHKCPMVLCTWALGFMHLTTAGKAVTNKHALTHA